MAIFGSTLLAAGCETADPTSAVLDNAYEVADPTQGTAMTIYKAWWSVALFPDPVAAGQASDAVRVVQGTDYAYALLAPGWDPTGGGMPSTLVPVRTAMRLTANRGDVLHIVVSDATTVGNCSAGNPLSADDAAFILERIFPGDFADATYDAATCTATPVAGDAGTD